MTIAALKALYSRIPELWLLDRHHTQLSVAAAGAVEVRRLGMPPSSLSEAEREP
jgi:hypothetical protein